MWVFAERVTNITKTKSALLRLTFRLVRQHLLIFESYFIHLYILPTLVSIIFVNFRCIFIDSKLSPKIIWLL